MSLTPTPITEDLHNYLLDNFSAEDDFLKNLRKKAVDNLMPEITISPVQGHFIQFLLKSINAKNVLEIGTLGAYSAIIMARALPDDGKVLTIESEYKHAVFAQKQIDKAGLAHKIEIQNSNAKQFLAEYRPDRDFDFVFADADKDAYVKYLDITTPWIRKGGIFAADNAFAFGYVTSSAPERNPQDVKSITSFNQYFKSKEEYFVTLLSVGDGMIMGYKK